MVRARSISVEPMMASDSRTLLHYERSARRDVWMWAMLLVGGVFIATAYTVDPLENCDELGNCAPWLVPLAGIIGWCATSMAVGLLLVNPSRGYRIDPASGDLLWWKNRTARSVGDTGRIHPLRIASIRLDLRGDDSRVSLYGEDGERLPWFDEELIPWPYDGWAERFRQSYPHVRIDRLD